MKKHEIAIGVLVSVMLLVAAFCRLIPNSWTEILGFVTGGWCVYLVVREKIWNFPLGIANNIFFGILFFESGLYSDMSLQVVYLVLGGLGWYWWARGGSNQSALPIAKASPKAMIVCLCFIAVATYAQLPLLLYFNGKAPFYDALTTSISLAAQFLLNRKLVQSWYFWIAADLIYIPLYIERGLGLTALLYSVFLFMCLAGLREWRKRLSEGEIVLADDERLQVKPPIPMPGEK